MEGICNYLSADHAAAFGASQDRGADRRTASHEGTADHPALEVVLEEK